MPQPKSETEDRGVTPSRTKVKKQNSFQTFSTIGIKLLTKYRKSHTNGTSKSEETETSAKKRKKNSVLRRPSWRKLTTNIRQIANQITNSKQDRVPPINGYVWPPNATPAVVGLRNHGNTCFMNAVLQCLSHTDILAEYFVLDLYKADLKRRNKLNSKKFGTKGELTEQLGLVLKALWTCKDVSEYSSSFKAVVDRYGTQFRQNSQHDAQEFLFWLLDKVHEDLNTANKRKYKIIKNTNGRPDEDLAAETLANHRRCNNSFVQAVFQAQFRSSLTCPKCQKQSNTFDPFHCISVELNINQLTDQSVFLKVIYASQQPNQVKMGIGIPHGSSVMLLREKLVQETLLPADRIILTEIGDIGFNRILCDSHPLSSVGETDPVYCIETPKLEEDTPHILLLIANVKVSLNETAKRFGIPFCLQVPRYISFTDLQKAILKEMKTVLRPEVFAYTTPLHEMFRIRLIDPSVDCETYLDPNVEHPLFTEMIDMALSVFPNDAGPSHIKLLLEWSESKQYFASTDDYWVEHESVAKLQNKPVEVSKLTLDDCLDHYTKAETLSAEDAWRCPNCQKYLPVEKTLGLWSLPNILVIHFKRFRQHIRGTSANAAKLTTMVDFPLKNFDMSKHLAREKGDSSSLSKKDDKNKYQVSSSHYLNLSKDHEYDLYAVCYHQGDTLETGHYTAACKNPYDHQWYKFDDQNVTHVENEKISSEIVNNEAYMLFYQRRRSDDSDCSGASSSSSEHWVSRILGDCSLTNEVTTKSSTLKSTASMMARCELAADELHLKKNEKEIKVNETNGCLLISVETRKDRDIMQLKELAVDTKPDSEETKENIFFEKAKEETKSTTSKMQSEFLKDLNCMKKTEAPVINLKVFSKCESIDNRVNYRNTPETALSMAKNKSTPTIKRNLIFNDVIIIDQAHQNLSSYLSTSDDDDDVLERHRSLWISPVTPHKLITVSPKN